MNAAELQAAERQIMEEALTGGMALTSRWDTLQGKIDFIKHIGLAKVMKQSQKEWVMTHHERISISIGESETTLTIKGSGLNSRIWKGLIIGSKVHLRVKVNSVIYNITEEGLVVRINH